MDTTTAVRTVTAQVPAATPLGDSIKTSGFQISNGLIEIAALTALIGSTTTESLTLGNRGAAGLPWATISIFGSLSVVKACVAAATPAYLRETVGVISKPTDEAVGSTLSLLGWTEYKGRDRNGIGIMSEVKVVRDDKGKNTKWEKDADYNDERGPVQIGCADIYAFDSYTQHKLELIGPTNLLPAGKVLRRGVPFHLPSTCTRLIPTPSLDFALYSSRIPSLC